MPVIKTRTTPLPFAALQRAICEVFFSGRPFAMHSEFPADLARQVGSKTYVRALYENAPVDSTEGTTLQRQVEALALKRLEKLFAAADDDFLLRVKALMLEREKSMAEQGRPDALETALDRADQRTDERPSETSS